MPYQNHERAHPVEGQHLPATTEVVMDENATWVLTMSWQVIEGRPECVGIDLRSTGNSVTPDIGAPLTTGLIRDLKIGEHIRAHRAKIAARYTGPAVSGTAMRRSTRQRLEEAARVYRDAFARGERPAKAVAEHFGLSAGGGSNLVARARAAGLLPPTSPGAAQGTPVPDNDPPRPARPRRPEDSGQRVPTSIHNVGD